MKPAKKPEVEKPDKVTQMGDAIRARANKLTEAEREHYLTTAMQMIYGTTPTKITQARR
jgi:hypothetical protein